MTDSVQRIDEVQRALFGGARAALRAVADRLHARELEVEGLVPGDAALRIRCADKTIYVCGHEALSAWTYFVAVHRNCAGASSGSWYPYAARDLMIERLRGEIGTHASV